MLRLVERERERGDAAETHKGGGAMVKSRRESSVRRARARAWESVRRETYGCLTMSGAEENGIQVLNVERREV